MGLATRLVEVLWKYHRAEDYVPQYGYIAARYGFPLRSLSLSCINSSSKAGFQVWGYLKALGLRCWV